MDSLELFQYVFFIDKYAKISQRIHQLSIIKKNKGKLKKKARESYQTLSEYEKQEKRRYFCEKYKNVPEKNKQKLVEHSKNYKKC